MRLVLPETYFTVWSNVFFNHTLPENGNFLVHGGAGGIGSTAIQLGAALGLSVYNHRCRCRRLRLLRVTWRASGDQFQYR